MCDRTHLSRREFVRYAAGGAASVYLAGCATSKPKAAAARPPGAPQEPVNADDWNALADLALQRVRAAGAEYGDIRILDTTSQSVFGQDRRIAGVNDSRDRGFGVRVLYKGAWGFAASSLVTPEEARRVADQAVEIAKGSASLLVEPVKLAPEPPHRDTVTTARRIDPFAVPLEEKTKLLLEVMEKLHQQTGIQRSNARLWAQRDRKLFASLEGARIQFDLLALNGSFGATAVHEGRFTSRGFNTPYLRAGYELIEDANFLNEAPRIAAQAYEMVQAPTAEPGAYDLVLDPEHLSLTLHESCGHPTELDRALGYEANYAGTSFLTPEKLGKFRYGSPKVTIMADNTESGTLAATGYDDDGVAGQRWPIIQEGTFMGYSTNREVAGKIGEARSRGSCRADSWANVPIVRIANVGLEPGDGKLDDMLADVKRGIYIEGHGSFSIDQKRYNFQFGGDAFWRIENGKRTHMLRDVIYTGITPEFWAKCDAVADAAHRRRYGFITCGKGQPGQSGWMTHAAAHARFRGVNVIRGGTNV